MKPYILPTTAQVAVKLNQQLLQTSGGGAFVHGNNEPPEGTLSD